MAVQVDRWMERWKERDRTRQFDKQKKNNDNVFLMGQLLNNFLPFQPSEKYFSILDRRLDVSMVL